MKHPAETAQNEGHKILFSPDVKAPDALRRLVQADVAVGMVVDEYGVFQGVIDRGAIVSTALDGILKVLR